jgi:hypothetical protein
MHEGDVFGDIRSLGAYERKAVRHVCAVEHLKRRRDMKQEGDASNVVTEQVREGVRKFAEENTGWPVSSRKIKAIWVNTGRYGDIQITLGDNLDSRISDMHGETVLAIFESTTFLVCTPNRGVQHGLPYLFAKNEVVKVEEFE